MNNETRYDNRPVTLYSQVAGLKQTEGLTLAEIGQVLGVTESRICQMHTKAVLQLRGKLNDQRD